MSAKPKREGHVARWPRFYERAPRSKTPCLLVPRGDELSLEGELTPWAEVVLPSGHSWEVHSYAECVDLALRWRLDLFVYDLDDAEAGFPWLDELKADPKAEQVVLPNVGRVMLRISRSIEGQSGRFVISVGQTRSWGNRPADLSFLTDLVATANELGVGSYPTPGALGQAVMRKYHKAGGWAKVSRPNTWARKDLLENSLGGYVFWQKLPKLERVYEIDVRNAYADSASQPLPIGTALRITPGQGEPSPDLYTWFCYCKVYQPQTLKWTPVCKRDKSGIVLHASTAGWHEAWLWKQDAELVRELGGSVVTVRGWGWAQSAPMLKGWADEMDRARAKLGKISRARANLVKGAIVAAIGRHAMRPEKYTLVDAERASETARPLITQDERALTNDWIETEVENDAPNLTHWNGFIVMLNRVKLIKRIIAEERSGNVIVAANYDAVYTLYPSILPLGDELGQFRLKQVHHGALFPYPRGLLSEEAEILPGLHGAERQAITI